MDATRAAVRMSYCPDKPLDRFRPGDWKWLTRNWDEGRAGFVYMNPEGEVSVVIEEDPGNANLAGDRWTVTGDESTGLTVRPMVRHGGWSGVISDGFIRTRAR